MTRIWRIKKIVLLQNHFFISKKNGVFSPSRYAIYLSYATMVTYVSVLEVEQFLFPYRIIFNVFAKNGFCSSFKQPNCPPKKKQKIPSSRILEEDIGNKQSGKELYPKVLMMVTCLDFSKCCNFGSFLFFFNIVHLCCTVGPSQMF